MTTLFDSTDVTVEIAFGDDPLETSPTWTDVSGYVRSVEIDRGRSSEYVDYSAGTMSVELDNRDRRFDPDHTSSPYSPNVVPMTPIRVTAQYSTGTTYTVFYGFILGWPTSYDRANVDAVCTVRAIDGNRILANSVLSNSAYEQAVIVDGAAEYWPTQDDTLLFKTDVVDNRVMEYLADYSPDTVMVPTGRPEGADLMIYSASNFAIPQDATELGVWPVQALECYYSFWLNGGTAFKYYYAAGDYFFLSFNTVATDYVYVGYSNSSDNLRWPSGAVFDVALESGVTPGFNGFYNINPDGPCHVAVARVGSNLEVYVEGVKYATIALVSGTGSLAGAGNPPTFDGTGTSHLAVYSSGYDVTMASSHAALGREGGTAELSSARLTRALDEISWPAGWRSIGTGVQQVAGYAARGSDAQSYLSQIAQAEQGAGFVNRDGYVELRNRNEVASANPVGFFGDYLADDLPIQDVTVDGSSVDTVRNYVTARGRELSASVSDAASIAAYGNASEELDVPLVTSRAQLEAIAQVRLDREKEPRTRVTQMVVDVRSEPSTLVDVIAALDLTDDAVVAFTPTSTGTALWRAVRVQGFRHSITPSSWQTTVYLAPGPTNENGPLFVLNHPTYGELNAGNKLG